MRLRALSAFVMLGTLPLLSCQRIGGFEDFETASPSDASAGGFAGATGGASAGGGQLAAGNGSVAGVSDHAGSAGAATSNGGAGAGGDSTNGGQGGSTVGAVGTPCADASTCGELVCLFGYCRSSCSDDTQCPAGSVCLGDGTSGGCRLQGDAETKCDNTCSNANLSCGIDGTCRTGCSDTHSCAINGQDCIQGSCVGENETGWTNTWGQCQPVQGATTCGGTDGRSLVSCNVTKPGPIVLATCDSAALCAAGLSAGACATKTCDAGVWTCTDAMLQHCTADETGYDMLSTCTSPELCTAGLAASPTSPMCKPPVCGAGSTTSPAMYECKDGMLLTCSSGQQAYSPSDCMGRQCDPGQGACVSLSIDATEVSRADYAAFLAKSPALTLLPTPACSYKTDFKPNGGCLLDPSVCDASSASCDKVPQVCVDWCDAFAYCSAKGEHLCGKIGAPGVMNVISSFDDPGQSEWMNVCSAGGQYDWSESSTWDMSVEGQECNGSNFPAHNAGTPPNSAGSAWEVDDPTLVSKCHSPAAPYAAAIDMSGNVMEWENSCSKTATAPSSGMSDTCLARGGSFNDTGSGLRCDASSPPLARNGFAPDLGFRCCGGS